MKKKTLLITAVLTLVFLGCSKSEKLDLVTLSEDSKELYYEETYQIRANSDSELTYAVENSFHGEVSESGLVTAGRVGETEIIVSNNEDSKKFKLTVVPKHNLYPEPDFDFGSTKEDIKALLGEPKTETETSLGYIDYSVAAPGLALLFDENNKLSSYGLMVKSVFSSKLADHLLEYYIPVAVEDGIAMFINSNTIETTTKVVGMSLYSYQYWQVLYIPYTDTDDLRSVKELDTLFENIEIDI